VTDSGGNSISELAAGVPAPPIEHDPVVNETVDFGSLDSSKIMLITPPYERIAPGYEFVKHITNRSPSLGLLHLAAAVREEGYNPSILESDIFDLSPDEVVDRVIEEQPAFVGITLFTVGTWVASEIAQKIKRRCPNIKIIVGGPHVSSMGVETIERFQEFDVAVVGEGEEIIVRLLKAYREGADLSTVPALIYRDANSITTRVIQTPKLAINKDLDRLPVPAWDLLPDFPNAYKPAVYDFPEGPVASIAASRGCPFHCKFCDTSTFGASVRAYDDLFTASKKRTTALCNLIIESGLEMTWSCASRVDVINPDTLALMKQAGCWEMSFGLESGSNTLLQKMDKSASLDKSVRAINWTNDVGIRSKGLFMLGYPGETPETMAQTKAFVKDIPLTIMNLTKFTPYPGSPIYRDIYGTSIRDDHWEKMNGMNFIWTAEGLTQEQLDKNYKEILSGFYMQHRVQKHYARFTFRHPHHLGRLSKFLLLMATSKSRAFVKRLFGRSSDTRVQLD